MEMWERAKSFAEEAAKRTQQTFASPSKKIADIVLSETTKLAAEASNKAEHLRSSLVNSSSSPDTIIKSLKDQIQIQIQSPLSLLTPNEDASVEVDDVAEMERLGVTDDLREFVRGLTLSTFQNFPVRDDSTNSDVPTVLNVRQDLTEWQQKHASLVLTTVKEISKLRYDLCPRHMNDGRFWRIYFTLVSTHVAPYERKYMEDIKLKEAKQIKEDKLKALTAEEARTPDGTTTNQKKLTSTSSSAEQDLDSFLLGDLDDSDAGPDDGDHDAFDDDFDKIDSADAEDEKQ